jgi:hypothetical protein
LYVVPNRKPAKITEKAHGVRVASPLAGTASENNDGICLASVYGRNNGRKNGLTTKPSGSCGIPVSVVFVNCDITASVVPAAAKSEASMALGGGSPRGLIRRRLGNRE